MRIVLTVLLSISLLLSSWLWYQLREANASLNGYVVSANYSALMEARRVEGMLREDDTSAAFDHLQRNRDVFVLTLKDVRSAISEPSWRWSPKGYAVEQADRALRDEAAYRATVGESDGTLATQVLEALASYRE
jgi:hypothetical protein